MWHIERKKQINHTNWRRYRHPKNGKTSKPQNFFGTVPNEKPKVSVAAL